MCTIKSVEDGLHSQHISDLCYIFFFKTFRYHFVMLCSADTVKHPILPTIGKKIILENAFERWKNLTHPPKTKINFRDADIHFRNRIIQFRLHPSRTNGKRNKIIKSVTSFVCKISAIYFIIRFATLDCSLMNTTGEIYFLSDAMNFERAYRA